MDLPTLLLNMAFQSGRLAFSETEYHYQLHARFCGMQIHIASVSKEDIKKAETAAKRSRFSVVS